MRRRKVGSEAGLGEPAEEMDRAPGRSKGSASKEKATNAAAMAVRGSHQGRRRTIAVQRQGGRSKLLTRMTLRRRDKDDRKSTPGRTPRALVRSRGLRGSDRAVNTAVRSRRRGQVRRAASCRAMLQLGSSVARLRQAAGSERKPQTCPGTSAEHNDREEAGACMRTATEPWTACAA